ncbi:MAG: ISL3 family transposase [Kosmotoga sp.]|nr:MAG: ISL3 family transposase [Kosmotoga sp.]
MIRAQVRNICIDDFATKKGQTYGTLMVDYETSKVVDMIPSRDTESVTEWLKGYPEIEVVSRDGSIVYSKAIAEALQGAMQVSDRFHLVKNLFEQAKEYIKRTIPTKIKLESPCESPVIIEKTKRTKLELKQFEKQEAKNNLVRTVKGLYTQGYSKKAISRELGLSRNTVRKYIRYRCMIVHASKGKHFGSMLDSYRNTIIDMNTGNRKAFEIYETIRNRGYKGSYSNVRTYLSKIRKEQEPGSKVSHMRTALERRRLISFLFKDISKFKESDQKMMKKYIDTNRNLQNLYAAVKNFRDILKSKDESRLENWLTEVNRYKIHELNTFVRGIERDIEAVKNAIKSEFSNGIIEGVINKIKVIKRVMYGRCSFELLKMKVMML